MANRTYDFLIVGAGIFGINAAIELRKRKYRVGVLNPDSIPHPLAASTDISKAVRMEYGTDLEYMDMAIECMGAWRSWNHFFKQTLYHEVGYLVVTSGPMEDALHQYEWSSFKNLKAKGLAPVRLNRAEIAGRFPAFNSRFYQDGFYHSLGGYVEAGKAVSLLTEYARQLGVDIHHGQTATEPQPNRNRVDKIVTREQEVFSAGHIIISAGNFTPYLLPELKPYFKITGHPVFHIKPSGSVPYKAPNLAVFGANISCTGWYGFPYHPSEGVVKVARHGIGVELHPEHDARVVTDDDLTELQVFLRQSIPGLADKPVVYTRRCCYTDTRDGHFWIDRHPQWSGLTVASGGSGHGFKMGPLIGLMVADMAEKGTHRVSSRYRWRKLDKTTVQQEEARCKTDFKGA